MTRKGVKSRRRITGLRSNKTKARTNVDRLRAANADLKKKLAEALEQQTATSEVLGVISSSPGELEPVFQAMLGNAVRICEAKFGVLLEYAGRTFRGLSWREISPEFVDFMRHPRVWGRETGLGRLALTKKARARS